MNKRKFISYCMTYITYGNKKVVEAYCNEQDKQDYTIEDINAVYTLYLEEIKTTREVGSACTHELLTSGCRTTKYYGRVGTKQ